MDHPVTAIEVPAPAGTSRLNGPDVVLYPEETRGDRGTYSMDGAGFIDDLVAEGVAARPYHDLLHSEWDSERDSTVLVLILGIASAAGWDAVKSVLARRSGAVKVTGGFRRGDETRWVEAEGDGPAVAEALDKFTAW